MKHRIIPAILLLITGVVLLICLLTGCEKADTTQETAENEQTSDGQQERVTLDGLVFTLQEDERQYWVTGTTADLGENVTVPAECEGLPVTGIGERAFADRTDLQSLTLPDSIKEIGTQAFENCKSLKKLILPSGVRQIGTEIAAGCGALEELTVPFIGDTVTPDTDGFVLGDLFGQSDYTGAVKIKQFYAQGSGSPRDKTYYIPASLRSVTVLRGEIPFGAFSNCTRLTNISLMSGVTNIRSYAFYGCRGLSDMVVPDSVTGIAEGAFSGCAGLVHITLPFVGVKAGTTDKSEMQYPLGAIFGTEYYDAGVYTTQYTCLSNQTARPVNYVLPASLTSVTVTGGYIPYGAFCMCSGLTKITLGNNVTGMHMNAVVGCTALHGNIYDNAFYLGNEENPCLVLVSALDRDITTCVTHTDTKIIAAAAFYQCQKLSYVSIWGTVTDVGSSAFWECTALTHVTILGSVAEINDHMFKGCTNLTAVTLSEGTQRIGSHAFSDCAKLAAITIPDSVTTIGDKPFEGCTGLETAVIGSGMKEIVPFMFQNCTALRQVEIGIGVTQIQNDAFYGCTSLRSITIPTGVQKIKWDAFMGCTGLEAVTLPDSIREIGAYAFSGCGNLADLVLPDGLSRIYEYAFRDCTALTDIVLPGSVVYVGEYAFQRCTAAIVWESSSGSTVMDSNALYNAFAQYAGTSITLPDTITSISVRAFSYCQNLTHITIPASVTSIGSLAFEQCTGLTSIAIPDSVTSISDAAFRDCANLVDITVGCGLKNVSWGAFSGCTGLKNVYITDLAAWCGVGFADATATPLYYAHTLIVNGTPITEELIVPETVTVIDARAFYGMADLARVTIPASVASVGPYAFANCTALTALTITEGVQNIDSYAFSNCTSLSSVTIPDSVTSIGEGAFWGCTGLTSITLGNDLTSIGSQAFAGCTGLTGIAIPTSVKNINRGAFEDCTGLTGVYITDLAAWCGITFSNDTANPLCCAHNLYLNNEPVTALVIPGSMTEIGYYMFCNCTGLTSVTISDSVTSIGVGAFSGCTGLTDILFGGTREQWEFVRKYRDWSSGIDHYTVHCTDGDLPQT